MDEIKSYAISGNKYTLHIKDATPVGGKCVVRFSINDIDNMLGVPSLAQPEASIDDIANMMYNKYFGLQETDR